MDTQAPIVMHYDVTIPHFGGTTSHHNGDVNTCMTIILPNMQCLMLLFTTPRILFSRREILPFQKKPKSPLSTYCYNSKDILFSRLEILPFQKKPMSPLLNVATPRTFLSQDWKFFLSKRSPYISIICLLKCLLKTTNHHQ